MKTTKYWEKRAAERMYDYQALADKTADDIGKAYQQATAYISKETEKVFRTFQAEGGLTEGEARTLLANVPDKSTLDDLKEIAGQIKDPAKKKAVQNIINSPAYAYRMHRFEDLQKDVDVQIRRLTEYEQTTTQAHYTDLATQAYTKTIFDIQKGTGIGFSFNKMPLNRIEEILRNNWSGKHFSERIWGRTDAVNKAVKEELLIQFMTGRSYRKTASEIQQRMAAGAMEARRLVRTESTYVANMAELDSYKECGIEQFQFVATLDIRTSALCREKDGKVYAIEDGVPGQTIPPLHPWCRSTTIAVVDEAVTDGLMRRGRDPVTGETGLVPRNMTYSEWEKQQDAAYGAGTVGSPTKTSAASSAVRNTGRKLEFDKHADFSVNLDSYAHAVNEGLSKASYKVAEKGGRKKIECLSLVDLKTGHETYYEEGDEHSVGGAKFWKFVEENPDVEFAFIHNHNTDGYFSEQDMRTLLITKNVKVFGAIRIDGVKYFAEKTKDLQDAGLFDDLFEDEIKELNLRYKDGIITAGERTKEREQIIVDGLLEQYTKGLVELDGRK